MPDPITQTMVRMNRGHTYDRSKDRQGGCIYCGSDGVPGKLTDEHIIPESIGGMLLIEKASCDTCAGETHAFEGRACNTYRPVRRQLSYPSKSRGAKDRERKRAERFVIKLDRGTIKVPAAEFPGLVMSLTFPPAGILFDLPKEEKPLTGGIHAIELLPGFGEKLNAIKAKYRSNSIGIVGVEKSARATEADFGRMLSKIAHSYVVAEFGLGNFRPLLNHIVRNHPPFYLTHFIGSALGKPGPVTDMHEIEIDQTGLGLDRFIVVRLRLFANLDGATHYIIAGEFM
jgi:hypothetical protein